MKIGFDVRSFLSDETGVGVYIKNLLFAMAKINQRDKFFLFSSSLKERFPKENIPDFKDYEFKDLRIPVSFLNFFWFKLSFPPLGLFFGEKIDITHSPGPMILPGGGKKIITVHDLSFIDNPELVMPEAIKYYSRAIGRSIKKADAVIAVSGFTKSRITELFGKTAGEKTTVIYHGTDFNGIGEYKPRFEIPKNYLMFTGTLEPRKNLSTLIKGFSLALKKNMGLKLILAGKPGSNFLEIKRLINVLKLQDDIIISGYISRQELKYLYKRASAFVFPSHYEGFGLPLLEAASAGIPSIASDIPVFREIFKNYPIYFNKNNPEELAEAITGLLSDKVLYSKKQKEAEETIKRFNWVKTAKETQSLYKNLYDEYSN